jgi:type I restriction enzyme, S subunit
VSLKVLRNFSVPRASLSQQRSAVDILDTVATETKRLEAAYRLKIIRLEDLKQAILHKAFAGELTAHPERALPEAAE